MVAGASPIFVATPRSPGGRATVANGNRDGATGTYVTLFTAGANGAFFKGFEWISEEDATANNAIRLFIQDAGAGNVELVYEAQIPTATFSVGVTNVPSGSWYPPGGIVLSASSVVKMSIHATDIISGRLVGGGDY
jgi:hypothetical protein